jgi:hypothetical protein
MLLAGFSALLIYELFHRKEKINLFTWFYLLAAVVSVFSMSVSPSFPERALLITIVFSCIPLLGLCRQIKINLPANLKRNMALLIMIGFLGSYLVASRNIVGVYLKTQKRTQYIIEQKEKGILDIEITSAIPAGNEHSAFWGQEDLTVNPDSWLNIQVAAFYEIKTIKFKWEQK